jgi:hypothetical protein
MRSTATTRVSIAWRPGGISSSFDTSSLAQGTRRVLERHGPRVTAVEVIATDKLGRELHAVGRSVCHAEVILFPDRGMWWQQYAWDYDGHTGAIGEDQEYYGLQDYRLWHRAGPEAWAKR